MAWLSPFSNVFISFYRGLKFSLSMFFTYFIGLISRYFIFFEDIVNENRSMLFIYMFIVPSNIKSYAHKISATVLSKHELNKDNNQHGKVDLVKPMRPQPKTKN